MLFGGGTGDGIEQVDRPSVPDSVARWSRRARCSRKRRRGDTQVVVTRYTRCGDRVRVALYALVGGGHGYPGIGQCPLDANQPCASNAINAPRLLAVLEQVLAPAGGMSGASLPAPGPKAQTSSRKTISVASNFLGPGLRICV